MQICHWELDALCHRKLNALRHGKLNSLRRGKLNALRRGKLNALRHGKLNALEFEYMMIRMRFTPLNVGTIDDGDFAIRKALGLRIYLALL